MFCYCFPYWAIRVGADVDAVDIELIRTELKRALLLDCCGKSI
jgi:hypothetical protein